MSENICPKCKSEVRDRISGDKKIFPRWKTKIKGKEWECRYCGFIKKGD